MGVLEVETEVIMQAGKLHVNDWQVACGAGVESYKLYLKPAHHTTRVYKSIAMLKTTVLFPTGLLTTWSPAYVLEKVHGAPIPCLYSAASRPGGSASAAWTMCTTSTFSAGQIQAWGWQGRYEAAWLARGILEAHLPLCGPKTWS